MMISHKVQQQQEVNLERIKQLAMAKIKPKSDKQHSKQN